jgi:hypothetical protein
MITFKEHLLIEANQYPPWVKTTVLLLTLKIKSLEAQIKNERDVVNKINLLTTQLKLASYVSSLGIAVDTKDKTLVRVN